MSFGMEPYLALILLGFLPSEGWRWLGIMLGRGLDEESEIILWVRGVATALVAAVVARIVLIPPGALASVPLSVRVAAIGCGFPASCCSAGRPLPGVKSGAVLISAPAARWRDRSGPCSSAYVAPCPRPKQRHRSLGRSAAVGGFIFIDGFKAALRSVFFYVLVGS
jgi:hypothetical protein